MPERLAGRVALVTGGTSGIGEATVELFITEGAKVIFTGRGEEQGRSIESRLGPPARFLPADVTRESDIQASVQDAVASFGRLDILFNNAGGPTPGSLENVSIEQFRYAMDLLLGSVVFGIKHAAPIMKRQGAGRIINNSSIAALRTDLGEYLYSAAKAAVTQVTRLAGMELGRYGVTVNSISPGAIATPIFYGGSGAARGLSPEQAADRIRSLTESLARGHASSSRRAAPRYRPCGAVPRER